MVKKKLKRDMMANRYRPPEVPIGDSVPKPFPKNAKCAYCKKPYTISRNTSTKITYVYCRTRKPKVCPNSGILRDIAKYGVTWGTNEVM